MSSTNNNILIYQKLFLDSVNRGIADAEGGKFYTTDELKVELEKRRLMRQSKSKRLK
jgi:predicted transcriptional regulator